MSSLVEFEVFRDHLGVAATDPAVDDVSRLLDAICAEVRRMARRDFEGDEGGSYDQVIRIRGEWEITLPHVPVRTITSISRQWFDGTEEDPYLASDFRLEDATRGLIRLRPGAGWLGRADWDSDPRRHGHQYHGPDYVRVVWTTTGEIPADIPQAVLDWGKARWDTRDRVAGLVGYTTGQDSETYSEKLAGQPPRDVSRAILGTRHATGGGVV